METINIYIYFFFLHYQLIFDVLSINSIVYLIDGVADLMYNEGNKKNSVKKKTKQIRLTTDKINNDYYLRFNAFS